MGMNALLKGFYFDYLSKFLGSRFYGGWFYDSCAEDNHRSHPIIARSIIDYLNPSKVIDFGCGDGLLLSHICQEKIDGLGFEFSKVGLSRARKRGVRVKELDFRQRQLPAEMHGDVVISLEVAEHLEEKYAAFYVECLSVTIGAKYLVFSAALPGQGGEGHYNEQPKEYWIDKLGVYGWSLDRTLTTAMQENWRSQEVSFYYWQNLLIFSKTDTLN